MVDTGRTIGLILLILICFGMPIGGCMYLSAKGKRILKPFFVGMLVFFISQLMIRIPTMQFLASQFNGFTLLPYTNPWVYGFVMGGSAALAEELGRYIGMRFFLKNNHRFVDGIAFGFGHGGIEAMLLVGVTNIFNLVIINSGINPELSEVLTISAIAISGFERICTMVVQIGFSVMVLYSVHSKKGGWLIVAILLHTIIDATIVILPSIFGIGNIGIEGFLAIFAIGFLIWLLKVAPRLFTQQNTLNEEVFL